MTDNRWGKRESRDVRGGEAVEGDIRNKKASDTGW